MWFVRMALHLWPRRRFDGPQRALYRGTHIGGPMLLRTRTMLVLTSLAVFTPAAALHAQACCYAPRRHSNYGDQSLPSFQITPYAGYMNFGRYINGPLGSQIPFANGPVVGGQASL